MSITKMLGMLRKACIGLLITSVFWGPLVFYMGIFATDSGTPEAMHAGRMVMLSPVVWFVLLGLAVVTWHHFRVLTTVLLAANATLPLWLVVRLWEEVALLAQATLYALIHISLPLVVALGVFCLVFIAVPLGSIVALYLDQRQEDLEWSHLSVASRGTSTRVPCAEGEQSPISHP